MRLMLIVLASVVVTVVSGCKQQPTGFPLSIATVQKIDSGSIDFEEEQGKIIVRVTDKFRDSHIHILDHDGMTKADALAILEAKQAELKGEKSEQR
jgi:hypothetical protein